MTTNTKITLADGTSATVLFVFDNGLVQVAFVNAAGNVVIRRAPLAVLTGLRRLTILSRRRTS